MFKDSIWKKRSVESQELVRKMLNKNPSERISAIEALNSEWIINASNQHEENFQNGNNIIQNLQSFHVISSLNIVSK